MDIIDDEGNIFGTLNIIDALVILFTIAVIIAGAALVMQLGEEPDDDPDLDTIHATLELGTYPEYIVNEINVGDQYSPDEYSTLTITDKHTAPTSGDPHVTLQVELEGEPTATAVEFDNAPPRLGRTLDIQTDRYQVSGDIRALSTDDSLETKTTEVLLETEVSQHHANQIQPGDLITHDDRELATVQYVETYRTSHGQLTSYIGVELTTIGTETHPQFGDTSIQRGNEISLSTPAYDITGTINEIGTLEPPGTERTTTAILRMEGVHELYADVIEPGLTETTGEQTLARVTGVESQPSPVVLEHVSEEEGASLEVFEHPFEQDLIIEAELTIRETSSGPLFKGQYVNQGDEITLHLNGTTVRATVIRL